MNKVFKVVWSKSKECYVVVPEIAKNNSGKKKVLASVLAGLALVGVGAQMGTPVDAYRSPDGSVNTEGSRINIAANAKPNNTVGVNSIVVGYQNTTDDQNGTTALGANNIAKGNSALAVGNENTATNGAATAIGAGNEATGDTSVAIGNKSNASGDHSIAIGAYNNQNWTQGSNVTTPKPAGAYSLAVGNYNDALGSRATAIGSYTTAKGEWATAIGAQTTASGNGDVAIGDTTKTNATGVGHAVAVGWHAETGAANAVAVGPSALASGKNSVSVGTNNNSRVQDTVTMGQDNDAKTMGGIAIGKNNMVDSTNGGTNHPETRDENSQIAIGRDNTATHLDTIAIGRDTHATGSGATVVGARADASGNNAIAIGNSGKNSRRVTASGVNSIAVGMQSQATGEATIAQGAAAEAAGNFGIAVGRISKAKANYSQAYGNEATSSTMGSIAMGALAKGGNDNGTASEGGSVAVGNAAWATGNRAIAIGSIRPTEGNLKYPTGVGRDVATGLQGTDYNTQATANQAIAVGSGARTDAQNSITMGTNAKVDATANGYTYQKTNNSGVKETLTLSTDPTPTSGINGRTTYDAGNGIAIGRDSHVTGKTTSAIAIGNSALADDGAVAATVIGAGASSKSVSSVAIGTTANVQGGEGAIAVGSGATVTGNYDNASAFGSGATVNKTNGTALGAGAQTNVRGGVAIGALSQADERSGAGESTGFHAANRTREYQGENKGLADNNLQLFHADIAGGDAGMVSVGSDGIKRQITNVASGTSDYDAVNVAQLRNVGVVVTGDTGKSDFLVHDGKLNVLGTGRVSTTAANDGAKDSKITVAFDDTGMVKAGKNVTVDEKTVNGRTTYTINAADAAAKYDFLTNAKANGGKLDGNATPTKVESGQTVTYAAGKNLTVKQEIDQSAGEQTYTYSLNKNIDLTPDGSLKIGDTNITNNGLTINNGPSITKTGINAGGLNITNVKAGVNDNDAVNVSQLKKVRADERHIKPGEYAVDANGKVTMTYLDGNNNDVANEKAVITGIAKQDLSNINKGGETVIQNLAKKSIDMENGKNTTASHRDVNGVKTFKVDVEGDLTDITSITNKDGDGKVVFGGNQTVNVAGDHNINLNAKVGDITGLTNVTLDAPDFAKKGRAATEEQLKIVNNGFNNTVGLTGNTGATDLQKLNQAGGLSFGVIGANNGQYIKTTASGSNVAVDLSDDAKGKLNNTVEVRGKNAAKVTSVTENTVDGGKKTIYTVDVDNVTPTAASTEKVKAKANVTGSTDTNIAKVTPQTGDQYGDAGATYEVNVSRNDVKDAAREAVTVNTTNSKNNPITVTPVQDETNHNTTYTVTFDGNKAATQIPLTYKANGQNAQTVTLDKGLNFTNGRNTTASVDAEGVVKYDVNKDLVNINSISNTTNGPKMEFGPNSINITNGPINMGDQNITNLKSGGDVINNAANIGDVKRISKANDLHIAPTTSDRTGETTATYAYNTADKSVTLKYNDGNGTTQTGTIAKIDLSGLADQIKDGYSFSTDAKGNVVGNHAVTAVGNGKTVSYAAGDNLTIAQHIDNATGEQTYTYALSNDIKIGKDGKDGIDGKIGVNGKDGSSVVINGKDGSIGLNGKDGKDGLTIRGEKGQDGVDGKNGTNGITRIVYEDHNNNKHEVATLDDGMKYAGDDAQGTDKSKVIVKKLNETMDVVGGADKSKLTDNNIGVNNVDGKLKVQLSKEVNLTPSGSLTIGDTVVNNNGLTISGGPSIIKTGINAGNLNITNVKAGVNDTDAVNVKQLKDARTVVTSNDNSVTVNKTENGNQVTYDLHVAPGAAQSVWNVKSTGNTTADSETAAKTISDGKTVEMAAGKNLTVKQTSNNDGAKVEFDLANDIKIGNDGKDGRDGVDGKIGVNGKDGSSVVINGKDGSIGLNGKDGKDGLTMKGEKGADGVTRIVYEDHDNNKHEVATLDDGLRFDANSGGEKKNKLGSKVTVKGTGAKADSEYDSSNIKTSITQGADGNSEINIGLAKDLNNINTIKNGGPATFTIGGNEFKFDGGNVNMGGNNITNLKSGIVNNNSTDDTNGANIGDVKTISKANDIHVKDTRYTVNADKTVTLEYVDGNDKKINKTAVIDLSNLPTGGNAITYKANNQNAQTVSLDKGLNFMDGNYTKASVDADGIVKYDVTIGKVKDGVDGKPGVDGKDGIATVKTVVDTINNSGWKGDVTGNTVGNHTATIVKPGTTVNFGAGKNVTVEQIVNAVTGDHTYNYALSDDIKLGKDGKDGIDGRIGVNGKDGSSVVINGKDGSIGLNGKDGKDGLTMKAENGQPGLNGKDGITRIVYEDKNNNKHEVATLDDGLRFTGNNEVENKQKLGSLVKIKGEGVSKDEEATFESAKGNIAVTADGTDTLTVRLNKNIKGIDSIQTKEIHLGTPDNYTTIKKDGDRIKYGDKTIANTDELWTIQANGTDVPANGGKVNVKGADGITVSRTANGEMTISGSGLGTMNSFNVKSTGNTADGSETAAKKITDGKTVEFSGGNNVTVKQTSSDDGAKVEFALKNNIDLTQDGSLKIGDTKITNGGLVINNGPSITKDGINAGNKQITNVEDGVNDTDAVNVRQLKDAKTKLVDGQNTTVTGDGSKANPYKVNVEGDLNKITSITNKEGDGKLEFKGDQVVNVAGDNTIKLDGKTGDITGLTNKTLDSADFATKGRAATEEQLKLVQQEAAKKSTEKVKAKDDANNIAKVKPQNGEAYGDAGATYEVSVDKNDVKDVAREAVTVSGDNKAISVAVQKNDANHTTNYQVNFNGTEASKQIPLTYKENGKNARTVMLSDGLDFSNGVNTTAHTDAKGKVSFDVKGDLTNITSISNNSNGPKMSFSGDSINITGGSLSLGDNFIHNVKAGEKNTDAVNVSQLKAAKTEVEAGRNVTVEHRLGENGQDIYKVNAEAAADPRVDQLSEEIGHVGAQSAALSALKPIQYDPMEPTQIMAGYGNYRGNSALALGVAHYKNESTMFHAGVSWAGGNGHMMANAGVTWKVGNRDSEAAVADRYRKGPISSTYAMQQVASMKAQNAGLKGEVSDLKAENEQIKAQNAGLQSEVDQLKAQMAAMMAKLGM
ncbi:ESPR-type extended signal peptide-containing protein [Veillonella sp. ICM51a]|uniref:ESPR-type extended signal peptide-containing protein n=1 Tax=Veillonella sp. ICM51a TaxID=936591 RepID=UPI0004B82D52|nr:ESPR-type extended signal peptide-containing protein [Veillonella sp. ICM51a]